MYACSGLSGTPSRASAAAGAVSSASAMRPNLALAAAAPAGTPHTPTDAQPMLNTCTASPNETLTGISAAGRASLERRRPGASTKKSSSTGSPDAGTTSM